MSTPQKRPSIRHYLQTTSDNRRSVFTEATIDCKALAAQIEAFGAVPEMRLQALETAHNRSL
jgi:hypothetical protein